MKKTVSVSAGMLLAMLTVLGLAPSASAYPDLTPTVTADHQIVVSGGTWTATVSATARCDWSLEWNGQVRTQAASTSYSTVYHAPKVKKTTEIPLHASCTYDADAPAGRSAAGAATPTTRTATLVVTVVPSESLPATGTPSDEDLPNTGGPNTWFLLAGLALVVTGAGAVLVARRRAENGDPLAGPN